MQASAPDWKARLRQPAVLAGGAAATMIVLAVALGWTAWRWHIAADRLAMLERQAAEGFLQPPSSTRPIRIDPRSRRVANVDAGGLPARIDLRIAVRTDRYELFRLSLQREDGTAVLHAERLARDSNGELRLSFNSTLLPNGRYRIRIEGYTWRGELQPVEEAWMQIVGR